MHELVWIEVSRRKHELQSLGKRVGWVYKVRMVDNTSWSCHVVDIQTGATYTVNQGEQHNLGVAKTLVMSMVLYEIELEETNER